MTPTITTARSSALSRSSGSRGSWSVTRLTFPFRRRAFGQFRFNRQLALRAIVKRGAVSWRTVPILALGIGVAGCGGSPAKYDQDAFRSCLEGKGAITVTLNQVPAALRDPTEPWDGMQRYMPGAWLAHFADGESSIFFFGSKQRLEAARHWIKDIRQSNSDARIDGNVLSFSRQHPTAGKQAAIDACERAAKKT